MHLVRLKEIREFHRRDEKVHADGARRNDLERENCNTGKHSRQTSEDWKSSWKVGERNFFPLTDFPRYMFWLGTL